MAKLWQKGYDLNRLVEQFTVGNDHLLDVRLLAADAIASIAHSRMLASVGILSSDDQQALEQELRLIAREAVRGTLAIRRDQEDSHTFIEERLVDRVGEAGKRIHTGRSRNDQVLASTRLFAREGIIAVRAAVHQCASTLLQLANTHEETLMAGRTHLQPAMPTTFGHWAAAFAELLLDADSMLALAFRQVNRSPLGAAASFGVPLPLDRELVAELLGFDGIHHNVLAAVTSRGPLEALLLGALDQLATILSRIAADLVLFSLPEFGYVTLPPELCSGSSIMPQKRNPDGLELLRGKAATLSSLADRTRDLTRNLFSAYNRDVQETKEPLIRGIDLALEMTRVTELSLAQLSVHPDAMLRGFSADLLATDAALERVVNGESFRDAYRTVAESLDKIVVPGEEELRAMIRRRTATGTPGNPDLGWVRSELEKMEKGINDQLQGVARAVTGLAGEPLSLYPCLPEDRRTTE